MVIENKKNNVIFFTGIFLLMWNIVEMRRYHELVMGESSIFKILIMVILASLYLAIDLIPIIICTILAKKECKNVLWPMRVVVFLEFLAYFVMSVAHVITTGMYLAILYNIFYILFWAILCIYFCGMISKKKANIMCGISSGLFIIRLAHVIYYLFPKQLYISQMVNYIENILSLIFNVVPEIFVFAFFLLCIKNNEGKKEEN